MPFLIVGGAAALIWGFVLQQLVSRRRSRSWPTAPAMAVRMAQMRVDPGEGPRRPLVYAPVLRFEVPGRGVVEATPDYWSSTPKVLAGQWTTVRYDPARPEKIQLSGVRESGTAFLVTLAVIVPVVAAVLLFFLASR
jgi:hypothetical protein